MEFPGGLSAVLKLVHVLLSKLSYNLFPKLKHPRSPSPSFTLPHMSIWIKPFASWMTAGQSQSPSYTFTLQGLFSLLSHTPEVSLSPPTPNSFSLHPIPVHPPSISFPRNVFFAKLPRERELLLAVLVFAPGKCIWETGAGERMEEHQVPWPFNSRYGSREW